MGDYKSLSAKCETPVEEQDGILKQEKSAFRKYNSIKESFDDYVKLIQSNPRYQQALINAHDPKSYVTSLQEANYATDSRYSEKIMSILNSNSFKNMLKNSNIF